MSDIIAFSHKYKLDKITIEDIQNVSIFMIGCYSFCSYLYYNVALIWYGKNEMDVELLKPFDLLLPFVGFHACVDFFLVKSYDLKLHHLCILGIIFYNNYYNVSLEYRSIFLYPLLKTEISSIFYVLKYWLPKKTVLYNVNTMLFYILFVKLRIYDFYYDIIYDNITFDIVFNRYSSSNYLLSSILLLSCYGLYILNLYWFLIMNKILYKTITLTININTDILCHNICCYLHWINIPLSYCIYAYNPNEKYIFDMIGITILSMSSYTYHNDIYRRLYDKEIDEYNIPNKDNIFLFINDSMAINVRSFLVIVTNYYNSEYLYLVLLMSGIFHVSSIYHLFVNILELFIDYDNNKDIFLNCHNIISIIPIIFDVCLICMNSPTGLSIPFLFVNILIVLLLIVNPFYKLTHIGFHILLITQNYYMSLSNSM